MSNAIYSYIRTIVYVHKKKKKKYRIYILKR